LAKNIKHGRIFRARGCVQIQKWKNLGMFHACVKKILV
jgi:hypothetical protein